MKICLYTQGVNGVLQGRMNALELDLLRTKEVLENCDDYFQCQWIDIDAEEEEQNGNLYYQKRTVRISREEEGFCFGDILVY